MSFIHDLISITILRAKWTSLLKYEYFQKFVGKKQKQLAERWERTLYAGCLIQGGILFFVFFNEIIELRNIREIINREKNIEQTTVRV